MPLRESSESAVLELRALEPRDLRAAAAMLARAMRDNPLHVEVFGADAGRRERRLERVLAALLGLVMRRGSACGARADGRWVAVLGVLHPGGCRPPVAERLRVALHLAGLPPAVAWRSARWLAHWQRADATQPHRHFGPLGVLPAWRGRGIARELMTRALADADAADERSRLETDLRRNATFYGRLGFETVRCEPVLGVPCWFMERAARPHGAARSAARSITSP